MKKLINTVDGIVEDMIGGYVAAYGDIVDRLSGKTVVVRRQRKDRGKVGLVIGNGSGHEAFPAVDDGPQAHQRERRCRHMEKESHRPAGQLQ